METRQRSNVFRCPPLELICSIAIVNLVNLWIVLAIQRNRNVNIINISHSNLDFHDGSMKTPNPPTPGSPIATKPKLNHTAKIPTEFLIEESDFCKRHPDIEVIAYVHSVIGQVKKRMNTRRTWASDNFQGCDKSFVKMGVVFVVGKAKSPEEEAIVKEESRIYGDIVQGNYDDQYNLLTYKALSSLYWIEKNCKTAPWTLHADDDILLDVFLLRNFMELGNSTPGAKFVCKSLHGPVRREGKWAVTRDQMPLENYPQYCKGAMWLLATKGIPDILKATNTSNYLWVDDAFVTGVLAKEAGVGIIDMDQDYVQGNFLEKEIGRNISWYHLPETKRLLLWGKIKKQNNCFD